MVAPDTFIEPEKDLMVHGLPIESKTYGRVEPRALGLRSLKEEERAVPRALRQTAEQAVPEAANAAWVDDTVREAEIQHELPDLQGALVLAGTTFTGEGQIVAPEERSEASKWPQRCRGSFRERVKKVWHSSYYLDVSL